MFVGSRRRDHPTLFLSLYILIELRNIERCRYTNVSGFLLLFFSFVFTYSVSEGQDFSHSTQKPTCVMMFVAI